MFGLNQFLNLRFIWNWNAFQGFPIMFGLNQRPDGEDQGLVEEVATITIFIILIIIFTIAIFTFAS